MRTNDTLTNFFFYLGWLFAGVITFSISIFISLVVDTFVFNEVFGGTIVVDGQTRITEDYMLAYAFIPWFGIIIGLMQYLLLNLRIKTSRWWILTTTIGWSFVFLGLGFRYTPLGTLRIPEQVWYFALGGLILGLFVGAAQWVILRGHLPHAAWWIPANVVGFGVAGFIFADNISSMYEAFFAFTMPPISTGFTLLLLLDILPGGKNLDENAPLEAA
jgi:hypothetical protein